MQGLLRAAPSDPTDSENFITKSAKHTKDTEKAYYIILIKNYLSMGSKLSLCAL
jgi:hypothetical protein